MIDDAGIRAICQERLGRWTEIMVKTHSTPMILIAVGHDHVSGRVSACTLENLSEAELRGLLLLTLKGLQ